MVCTAMWPWSCSPTAFSFTIVSPAVLLRRPVVFPPCAPQPSLPAVHRSILVWLFQDVVLWLIESDQIKTFRPRRN
jgi:hypothetical protein